jgi:hypothetical protein
VHDRIAFCWRNMDAQVSPGRYLLGDELTVLDLYVDRTPVERCPVSRSSITVYNRVRRHNLPRKTMRIPTGVIVNRRLYISLLAAALLSSCASSKVSSLPVSSQAKHTVKVIAFSPGGGLLADAVGVELSNRGFTVIDSATMSSMMIRLDLSEIEITRPEGLA